MMSLLKYTEIKYTPWPDGFVSEFYQLSKQKKIYNDFTHLLPKNRKQKQKVGNAPNSVYVVNITLLPKLTKNCKRASNRSISLINVDAKFQTKSN